MPDWTPGPWRIEADGQGRFSIYAAAPHGARFEVCPAVAHSPSDACLIVAAPELYEVLETAPILSKYHGQRGFETERFIADYEAWSAIRRSTRAKARGEG